MSELLLHVICGERSKQKNLTDNSTQKLQQVLSDDRLFLKYPSKCRPRKGLWAILAVDEPTGQYLHGTDPNTWLTYHSNFSRVWVLT